MTLENYLGQQKKKIIEEAINFGNFAKNKLKKHQLIYSFWSIQGQAKSSTVGSQPINFELRGI